MFELYCFISGKHYTPTDFNRNKGNINNLNIDHFPTKLI